MHVTKAGKIHYLEPEAMAATGLAKLGFTTRHEGVSRPPFNSLNLGTGTLDSVHNVKGNQSLLARSMGGKMDRFVTVNQVHGVDLLMIDAPNQDFSHFLKLECDGIVTNQPGVMIGITVADCAPLLLLDPVQRVAAALHAGWKGTAGGIATRGVAAFVELFGSHPGDILAAIGPAIGSCCYEVDGVVKEAFQRNHLDWESVADARSGGKWQLDLVAANRQQLLAAGLTAENIAEAGECVACNPELFFSYRRDHGETGRQMGFIMLTD